MFKENKKQEIIVINLIIYTHNKQKNKNNQLVLNQNINIKKEE